MKKKTSILILILSILLLVSCNEDVPYNNTTATHSQGTTQSGSTPSIQNPEEQKETPIDYTKWENSYANYKIEYNEDTEEFETDCPYVCFIEKESGKDFVIINLTDIQLPITNLYEKNDEVILFKKTFEKLIQEYDPDLITITGDFGDYLASKDSLIYIADYIDSFDIPWAPVFGNHDNESSLVEDKATYLENCKNCLFKTGPENLGRTYNSIIENYPLLGNYVVNIVEGNNLINSLIFMNTGNLSVNFSLKKDSNLTTVNYGALSEKQIEWYEWAISSAKSYNNSVKSSIFIHIPIFEYSRAISAALNGNHSVKNRSKLLEFSYSVPLLESTDDKYWNEGYKDSFGVIYDDVIATTFYDDNVFASIKKMGSTNFVICGHDHSNNTVINYKDVQLVYGTKTGKGCYWHEGLSGGTKINISENSTKVSQIIYMPGSEIVVLSN